MIKKDIQYVVVRSLDSLNLLHNISQEIIKKKKKTQSKQDSPYKIIIVIQDVNLSQMKHHFLHEEPLHIQIYIHVVFRYFTHLVVKK